jgi:hypothetical protein
VENFNIVQLLLEAGADTEIIDDQGEKAFDLTAKKELRDLIQREFLSSFFSFIFKINSSQTSFFFQITRTERKNCDPPLNPPQHHLSAKIKRCSPTFVLFFYECVNEESTKDLDSAVSRITNDDAISLIDGDSQLSIKHSRF